MYNKSQTCTGECVSGPATPPRSEGDSGSGGDVTGSLLIATVVGAIGGVIVVSLSAVVVVRARKSSSHERNLHLEMRNVVLEYLLTELQRRYGAGRHDARLARVDFASCDIPKSQITRIRKIGAGESGEVWLGRLEGRLLRRPHEQQQQQQPAFQMRQQQFVAVKFNERNTEAAMQVRMLLEAHLLHVLPHEHIIQLVAVVTSEIPVLVCTEYMAGGDLKTFLRACRPTLPSPRLVFTAADLSRMGCQTAAALSFLEQQKVIHRDVAARNVFVNEDASTVKLGDFGAARDVVNSTQACYIATNAAVGPGSPGSSSHRLPIAWMAPEAILESRYSHASDVWSFGVFLWEVSSFARTPFGALGPREIVDEIAGGRHLQQPAQCSDAMFSLMLECWQIDPSRRPSFSQLYTRLTEGARVSESESLDQSEWLGNRHSHNPDGSPEMQNPSRATTFLTLAAREDEEEGTAL